MNFRIGTTRKPSMIQVAFVLFLVCSVIRPVEKAQQLSKAVNAPIADSTTYIISTIPDDTLVAVKPSGETAIETGINQSQTANRKTRAPKAPTQVTTETFIVPAPVQAENLLDQGYSVNDIANELGLTKREVRRLKRKLRREQRTAVSKRKKESRNTKRETEAKRP